MKRDLKKIFAVFYTAVCIFSTLVLLACTPEPVDSTPPGDTGFIKSYVQGQLTLDQRTGNKKITIADQLELVLSASAPENMKVEFPAYSVSLGDFTLIDVKSHPARMTGAGENIRLIHVTTYSLEPYLPGTYSIPAMPVSFINKNNDEDFTQLITEELQVTVKSILGQDVSSVGIKDIKGPLSLPQNIALQILLGIIFLLLVISGVIGFLYWRKISSNRKPVEVQLRPEEIALQSLEILLAENLLARGEVKLFHLRISDILRHYIENRFGFKAPERTTEEFLTELSVAKSQKHTFHDNHKTLLTDFLTHCDLVKFAKHEPTNLESEKTVSICREFIEETKETGERLKEKG